MGKKKKVEEDEGPSDAWLASYADAMTLLLAFFIMMYAFALIDESKFEELKVGVAAAFGRTTPVTEAAESILQNSPGVLDEIGFNPVAPTPTPQDRERRDALAAAGEVTPESAEALRQLLANEFEALGAGELVDVGIDDRGVYIRFDGRVLFAPNEADLDSSSQSLLATAADVLKLVDNHLEIEGHTDSLPATGRWPSNWELSSARASRVVRWMITNGGIPGPQLEAVGRADTRPRSDNSTEEGRAGNRRVEIVVRVPGMAESPEAAIDPIGDNPVGVDLGSDTSTDAAPPEVLPPDAGESDAGAPIELPVEAPAEVPAELPAESGTGAETVTSETAPTEEDG